MKPHTFRFDYKDQLKKTIQMMVADALAEDLNVNRPVFDSNKSPNDQSSQYLNYFHDKLSSDITAQLIPRDKCSEAKLICREDGVLCGIEWFDEVFRQLSTDVIVKWNYEDGDEISSNSVLCELNGPAIELLIGERTAMNFLQTLSGTATATSLYAKLLEETSCKLLDTRKTIPGFRFAQKYAVTCGGGLNHRIGLFDAYLIKENHINACGGIKEAINQARSNNPDCPIEIEVEDLSQLKIALDAQANVIMLDNFSEADMREAVLLSNGNNHQQKSLTQSIKYSPALEASGNITFKTIKSIAQTGVDYISVGAITKHIQALDLSLRVTN